MFRQSIEISPYLVTLITSQNWLKHSHSSLQKGPISQNFTGDETPVSSQTNEISMSGFRLNLLLPKHR